MSDGLLSAQSAGDINYSMSPFTLARVLHSCLCNIFRTLCNPEFSVCACPQLREMPVNSPEKPWRMDPVQVAERRDLRETHLVFSIDPRGCEDVDDTLSVRSIDGGKLLELGVHIADVTHFVTEGSLTDLEARMR